MLGLPKTTEFGRRIPKQKFYEHLDVSSEVKHLFVEQIRLITWSNKLSPQTMNIAEGQTVSEIEVFHIKLTGQELDKRTLELMDKQIPYHILFLLERPDGTARLSVSYKEAALTGATRSACGRATLPRGSAWMSCTCRCRRWIWTACMRASSAPWPVTRSMPRRRRA